MCLCAWSCTPWRLGESGGKALRILHLYTTQMSRVNFMPWPFYPDDRATLTHWTGDWMRPWTRQNAVKGEKSLLLLGFELWFLSHPIQSPVILADWNTLIPALKYILVLKMYALTSVTERVTISGKYYKIYFVVTHSRVFIPCNECLKRRGRKVLLNFNLTLYGAKCFTQIYPDPQLQRKIF
jgi:hypothetical protein